MASCVRFDVGIISIPEGVSAFIQWSRWTRCFVTLQYPSQSKPPKLTLEILKKSQYTTKEPRILKPITQPTFEFQRLGKLQPVLLVVEMLDSGLNVGQFFKITSHNKEGKDMR